MEVTGDPGLEEAIRRADLDPEPPVGETIGQIRAWQDRRRPGSLRATDPA
jgi:hypothetical protein